MKPGRGTPAVVLGGASAPDAARVHVEEAFRGSGLGPGAARRV